MNSAVPIWLFVMPMVLLALLAAAGLGGYALSRWLHANPGGIEVIAIPGLIVGGLVVFLLFGMIFVGRSTVVVNSPMPPMPPHPPVEISSQRQREILERLDAELQAHEVSAPAGWEAPTPVPPQPVMVHETVPSVGLVFGLIGIKVLFLIGLAVGAGLFIRMLATRNSAAVVKTLLMTIGGITVLLAVGATSLVAIRSTVPHQQSATIVYEHHAPQEPVRYTQPEAIPPALTRLPATDDGPVSALPVAQPVVQTDPVPTDDRTTSSSAATPPSWVQAGVQRRGDATLITFSSKQYATESEANQDARAAVRDYLLEERLRTIPREPFSVRSSPSVEHLVDDVVKDRYVEKLQRDFGSMFATMYRVWLRAEVTPTTYNQMRSAHIAQLQEGRIAVAGSALAALLCVPLGIVTYGQLNRWTSRRIPRILQTSVAAGIVGLWAAGWLALQQFVTLF